VRNCLIWTSRGRVKGRGWFEKKEKQPKVFFGGLMVLVRFLHRSCTNSFV
jgi:hypothetical protein